jgi:hypothetical protein
VSRNYNQFVRAAQSDRPTKNSPPRKPRAARRWVVVLALAAGLYVGGYSLLRVAGLVGPQQLTVRRVWSGWDRGTQEAQVAVPRFPRIETWRTRVFRPCIAIEEWWRYR